MMTDFRRDECACAASDLMALFDGEIDEASAARARAHLLSCPRCARSWTAWSQSRLLLRTTPIAAPPPTLFWRILVACRAHARRDHCPGASWHWLEPHGAPPELPQRILDRTVRQAPPFARADADSSPRQGRVRSSLLDDSFARLRTRSLNRSWPALMAPAMAAFLLVVARYSAAPPEVVATTPAIAPTAAARSAGAEPQSEPATAPNVARSSDPRPLAASNASASPTRGPEAGASVTRVAASRLGAGRSELGVNAGANSSASIPPAPRRAQAVAWSPVRDEGRATASLASRAPRQSQKTSAILTSSSAPATRSVPAPSVERDASVSLASSPGARRAVPASDARRISSAGTGSVAATPASATSIAASASNQAWVAAPAKSRLTAPADRPQTTRSPATSPDVAVAVLTSVAPAKPRVARAVPGPLRASRPNVAAPGTRPSEPGVEEQINELRDTVAGFRSIWFEEDDWADIS